MSYLHCHTKNCGWSQDDFWTLDYNIFTKIWTDLKWLKKPEMIIFDKHFVDELVEYTKVPLYRIETVFGTKVFSWNWLLLEIIKDLKLARKQKWWTYKSFKDDKNAVCPKCGIKCFDID